MADATYRKVNSAGSFGLNRRRKILLIIISGIVILAGVCLWGLLMEPSLYAPNYEARRLAPSLAHLFGTDNLGRDMFYRLRSFHQYPDWIAVCPDQFGHRFDTGQYVSCVWR